MARRKTKLKIVAIPPAIEERDGDYFITQSDVSFAAIILRFKEGLSPEAIRRECFPSLPLVKIYSAISFYLSHREQVEKYLQQLRQEEDELQQQLLRQHPEFIKPVEELLEHIGIQGLQSAAELPSLRNLFADVRADIEARGINDEELEADINAAVAEVRARS